MHHVHHTSPKAKGNLQMDHSLGPFKYFGGLVAGLVFVFLNGNCNKSAVLNPTLRFGFTGAPLACVAGVNEEEEGAAMQARGPHKLCDRLQLQNYNGMCGKTERFLTT